MFSQIRIKLSGHGWWRWSLRRLSLLDEKAVKFESQGWPSVASQVVMYFVLHKAGRKSLRTFTQQALWVYHWWEGPLTAGEMMAQWLRVTTVLPRDLIYIFRTHTTWLTTCWCLLFPWAPALICTQHAPPPIIRKNKNKPERDQRAITSKC